MHKRLVLVFAAVTLLLAGGCKPKAKPITSLQRKEAAALASEAQFAFSVRDLARAEKLLAQAAELCPDAGNYWLDLGRVRVRAGKRSDAQTAYRAALAAYKDEAAAATPAKAALVLREVYALALLGRVDEARALLARELKTQPDNRELKAFADGKELDYMMATPTFKETAL